MKKFISKIRNKRLKGNVSLLIIFILLAGSVIALLSINQIQHLLTYWNMTFNYFRSFYLAKAGTELWLTEVYNREAWFKHSIDSWDAIVTDNLVWEYAGFDPYFTMDIESNFKYLTDDIRYTDKCDNDNKIVLAPDEWIMLSLFRDNAKNMSDILNPEFRDIKPLTDGEIRTLDFWNPGWDLKFWIFAYNDNLDMADIIVKDWNNLNQFLNFNMVSNSYARRYLTIKNQWSSDVSFCIKWGWNDKIPYSSSLINVRANYWDMEVWLQSIVKKEVPFWALDVLK